MYEPITYLPMFALLFQEDCLCQNPRNYCTEISFRQFKMIGFESTKSKPELFLEPPVEKSQVMTEEIIISFRIFY